MTTKLDGDDLLRPLAPGIWQIEHRLAPDVPVHVHVVRGDYAAVIDTGVAATYPLLERALFTSGRLAPADVRLILNTHAHHDHIGSNRQLQRATGALVGAPAGAVPWIQDHRRHLREFLFHHPEIIPDTPALREEIGSTMDGEVRVDLALVEGTTLDLGRGVRLEALAVPGHVGAELAYFERGSGTLLLGDAVTRTDMPFFQGHLLPAAYRTTLSRLRALTRDLAIQRVAPAHYPVLDPPAFLALLDRLEHHLDEVDALVARTVREAGGPATLAAVWRGVCAASHKEPEFRSLAMVEAHLLALIAGGRITRSGPDQYTWLPE